MAAVSVILRFIMCLWLALLLFNTALGNTSAHALEDEEDFFSTEMEVQVDGSDATKRETGGRKMIENKVNIINKVEIRGSTGAAHGDTTKVSSENKVMDGESGSKGKGNNKSKNKVGMNGGGTNKKIISHFPNKEINNEAALAGAGFVAFNADYHAPRHHPPKNN